ncbi:HAD family phosphatase [Streptomyces sp. NPDC002790]|uniref:HAD family hydrolase n=1 Tax=Streptomyces sp. NPDC002790 TaxID=3154431 RepID=UPI00331C9EF8
MSDASGVSERDALRTALRRADGVIFDFDGPVCRLFPQGTAPQTAAIKAAVWGDTDRLPPPLAKVTDTHDLLKELRGASSDVVRRVTDMVTKFETEAVGSASATPHIGALVAHLVAADKNLAIASNNAREPILEFLGEHGMRAAFGTAVCGRDPLDISKMKPAPDTLLDAAQKLGLPASRCLLVGDKASDFQAAQAACMTFVGCTEDREELKQMTTQGARLVFTSLEPVLAAVTSDDFSTPSVPTPSRTTTPSSS